MVEMVVGEQHELDRAERVAACAELRLERLEGLGVCRPGVDERERRALQQPDVDGAEVGHRDLDPVHAGESAGYGVDTSHRRCLA
jgi:hypothetical protein